MGLTPTKRNVPRLGARLTATSGPLDIAEERIDSLLTGDHSGVTTSVALTGCRVERAQLLGTHLIRSRIMDCVVTGCDLSGTVLEDCVAARVEFHDCRLSSLQASNSRFHDVAFFGCRLDDANFRMTNWERAVFEDCGLEGADFYSAGLPRSHFQSCDLTGVDFSKSTLADSHFQHSTMERLRGAEALRGASITSDLILPVAMALFASMAIMVDDDR